MEKPRFFFTDVFTEKRYGGNPLATFILCDSLNSADMQRIAQELNFSETTFITSLHPRQGGYDVRIFTPKTEIDFAGHPCLGTAHVLRNHLMKYPANTLLLNLARTQVSVRFDVQESKQILWFQQSESLFGPPLDPSELLNILGLEREDLAPDLPIEAVSTGFPHCIVPLKNLASLKKARIDQQAYARFTGYSWAKNILVFSPEAYESHQDLAVRVFAGYYGVDEDPATGSGNACLAAYLFKHRAQGTELNLSVGQGHELGRPSQLYLKARQHQRQTLIQIGGQVVDVAAGVWG